jgi:aryl-alcohol dehydrogenase-like predicted oxidoreductase
MKYRTLGSLGWKISEVSFGAWAIGADWGSVNDEDSIAALNRAIDMGVNFIDTADVYGAGRSEKLIAKVLKERSESVWVATKAGRLLDPHVADGYNRKNLTAFVEQSLKNLNKESLDLVQLHCPPTEVYYRPEVFEVMDDLKKQGKIQHYGVSVEKVEEALKAIEYPNVETVQIVLNMFRQRPTELFFEQAALRKIGVIARVPLASGLLTGKMTNETKFEDSDHRKYNRHGEMFDKGETFAGVDYKTGLEAVEQLKKIVPENMALVHFALKWILNFDQVSCVIPGSKNPVQAESNVKASDIEALTEAQMNKVKEIYENNIKNPVHYMW